jgi:small subunit ribosomal protein S8
LKYDLTTKEPAIKALERVSRPGLRTYSKPADFKRVKNGLGVAILSTSKGVMTDKEAKVQNVGGEVLCYIY